MISVLLQNQQSRKLKRDPRLKPRPGKNIIDEGQQEKQERLIQSLKKYSPFYILPFKVQFGFS